MYGAIASGTKISDDDKATLKSLAVSSADAEATGKATAYYRAKLEKNYTLSDKDAKAINDKYANDNTLTADEKKAAIEKAIAEKKKADIDAAMATDESKAAIAGLVENGIQDVTDAGIASEDASQYTFVGKAERDKIANTAVENSVDAYNNAEKKLSLIHI